MDVERRIIPGQYLAIDLKERAVMIGIVYFYLIFNNFIEYVILLLSMIII